MINEKYPIRKNNRLRGFDYSSPGFYFITVCTKDRRCLFWKNYDQGIAYHCTDGENRLSDYGRIVDSAIKDIGRKYLSVNVDYYVIMPNHIHLLLRIGHTGNDIGTPSICRIIQQMKGHVTKRAGSCFWQKSYHDHIIRGRKEYYRIAEYIVGNPVNWERDCLYSVL